MIGEPHIPHPIDLEIQVFDSQRNKKTKGYFQDFRVFFISLRIKKLRFMKRLGAECGVNALLAFIFGKKHC